MTGPLGPFLLYSSFNEARASQLASTMASSFLVNAGGLIIKHSKDQLLSLTATLIATGKPGTGFSVQGVACVAKDQAGRLMMGRSEETMVQLFNETSDDIVARIERWTKQLIAA
jgi:hypothetical protein